jgi:hypothetical protein
VKQGVSSKNYISLASLSLSQVYIPSLQDSFNKMIGNDCQTLVSVNLIGTYGTWDVQIDGHKGSTTIANHFSKTILSIK